MTDVSHTAHLNGRNVKRGDKIVTFRGETLTFDYIYAGKVYTLERPNALNPQVFPPDAPKPSIDRATDRLAHDVGRIYDVLP